MRLLVVSLTLQLVSVSAFGTSRLQEDRSVLAWLFTDFYSNDTLLEERIGWLSAHRHSITTVSPTTHTLGANGDLVERGFNVNVTRTRSAAALFTSLAKTGLKVLPTIFNNEAGQSSLPPKMATLFAKPDAFIKDAVKLCIDHDLDGWNIDFETGKGTVSDKQALDYVAFMDKFGAALHAKGKVLSVDILVSPTSHFWNNTALNLSTGLDRLANMGTYTASYSTFIVSMGRMADYFSLNKIGVGLCPGCLSTPFTDKELEARFAVIEELGVKEIDIWEGSVPDNWLPHLQRFLAPIAPVLSRVDEPVVGAGCVFSETLSNGTKLQIDAGEGWDSKCCAGIKKTVTSLIHGEKPPLCIETPVTPAVPDCPFTHECIGLPNTCDIIHKYGLVAVGCHDTKSTLAFV